MFVVKIPRSKFYQVVYFVDGKRKTISTKTTIQREAWKFLEEFQKKLQIPVAESVPHTPPKSIPTLKKFCDEYVEYMKLTKSTHYVESIISSFRFFINDTKDIALNLVDNKCIDKFITATFARTQRGAHQYYRNLKAAFNKAVEWNYLDANPFTKVKFPKISKSFPVFMTENELELILSNTLYDYLKDIFTTAFYTGLRLGELINMRWKWVDIDLQQITVKCDAEFTTKNKRERIVPICEKVKSTLTKRKPMDIHESNEYVFYRIKGKKLHQETISKQFKTIVLGCKLNSRIHFHSLRHSFASLLVQKGASIYVVKELLGHEDLATTQIYSHLQQQNLRDAIKLL